MNDFMRRTDAVGQGRDRHLVELNQRLGIVRDRVRAVALRRTNGLYLWGRAGTSKTYTIRTTLEKMKAQYCYHDGHLTPLGLLELFAEHHDQVVVLDDVSELFSQKTSLQLLLAALGTQPDHTGVRPIKYKRQGQDQVVRFTGGVIAISNLELHKAPLLTALRSRVHYLKYEPSDEQLVALMYDIAARGFPAHAPTVSPEECLQVVDVLVSECKRLDVSPDIRLLVDKSLPDYLMCRERKTETHWQDLVTSTIEEQLVALQHTQVTESSGRAAKKQMEQQIARDIAATHKSRADRIMAWQIQTGKSERAFYRRL